MTYKYEIGQICHQKRWLSKHRVKITDSDTDEDEEVFYLCSHRLFALELPTKRLLNGFVYFAYKMYQGI